MDVLNTDLLNEDDKEIQIDDKIYLIPADIPTKLYFKLLKIGKDKGIEGMEEGIDILYEIFKIRQPELNEEQFLNSMTINKYTAITNFIFAGMSIEETMKLIQETKESIKDGKKKPSLAES